METSQNYKNQLEEGSITINNNKIEIEKLLWNEHAAFKGVFMKHIITGAMTNNAMSYHLVKINPNCEIGLHNHIGKLELHEIVSGKGTGIIEDKEVEYIPGVVSYIPQDKNHRVLANEDGLFLLAKFVPALL